MPAASSSPALMSLMLEGLRDQMRDDGCLSTVESHSAGPVPCEQVLPEDCSAETEYFWDSVNSGYLDPAGVRSAREEELRWVESADLFDLVARSEVRLHGEMSIPTDFSFPFTIPSLFTVDAMGCWTGDR